MNILDGEVIDIAIVSEKKAAQHPAIDYSQLFKTNRKKLQIQILFYSLVRQVLITNQIQSLKSMSLKGWTWRLVGMLLEVPNLQLPVVRATFEMMIFVSA